jgi:hypothetical protein
MPGYFLGQLHYPLERLTPDHKLFLPIFSVSGRSRFLSVSGHERLETFARLLAVTGANNVAVHVLKQ